MNGWPRREASRETENFWGLSFRKGRPFWKQKRVCASGRPWGGADKEEKKRSIFPHYPSPNATVNFLSSSPEQEQADKNETSTITSTDPIFRFSEGEKVTTPVRILKQRRRPERPLYDPTLRSGHASLSFCAWRMRFVDTRTPCEITYDTNAKKDVV